MNADQQAAYDAAYDAAVRETAAALPPLPQEARDRLTLLFRSARPAVPPAAERRAS